MSAAIRLRGARVVDRASGRDEIADVVVARGVIQPPDAEPKGVTELDCTGLILAPGLVDPHTHLREPGREDKETVETGCRAAALGGVTAVSPMANTDPGAQQAGVHPQGHDLCRTTG